MTFFNLTREEEKGANAQRGFTLIEILVVIGIIAVLAAVVLIAINPARQFAQARDSQRTSNVNAILNAVGQNLSDNAGVFDADFDDDGTDDCDALTIPTAAGNVADDDIDIAPCLVPDYMNALPVDPSDPDAQWTDETDYETAYTIEVEANGRITVCAPVVEPSIRPADPICITR